MGYQWRDHDSCCRKDLKNQEQLAYREYRKQVCKLEKEYKITSDHYNYDYDSWTKNDRNFDYEIGVLYTEYENKQNIICAKRMARFLIATNIARRGKLLHLDNAIRELQKYGPDGEEIIQALETPIMPMVLNSQSYLAQELHCSYHVTLMDNNLLNYCINMIKMYQNCGKYGEKGRKHYENFVKKFHKKYTDNYRILRQNLDQRSF